MKRILVGIVVGIAMVLLACQSTDSEVTLRFDKEDEDVNVGELRMETDKLLGDTYNIVVVPVTNVRTNDEENDEEIIVTASCVTKLNGKQVGGDVSFGRTPYGIRRGESWDIKVGLEIVREFDEVVCTVK